MTKSCFFALRNFHCHPQEQGLLFVPSPLILLLKSNFLCLVSVVFNIIEKHYNYAVVYINSPKTGYAHYGVSTDKSIVANFSIVLFDLEVSLWPN